MRTAWIALGGAVFFGCYEKAKNFLQDRLDFDSGCETAT